MNKVVSWQNPRRNEKNKGEKGFTLIELLVVIAIIAILAAILFPVFISVKNSGKLASCKTTMKQMSAAMLVYADDWSGTLPCWVLAEVKNGRHQTWDRVIQPYMKNNKILRCPADAKSRDLVESGEIIIRTYSYPAQLGGNWSPQIYDGKQLSEIPRASRTVMLAERYQGPGAGLTSWWGSGAIIDALGRDSRGFENVDFYRHVGNSNFAFADGHIAARQGDSSQNHYPKFPGYQLNNKGVAACAYGDPLPQ